MFKCRQWSTIWHLGHAIACCAGITAAVMQGATQTLAQIQQQVLQYVDPETLLVGHSLENDLKVLKLVHLRNLDTAIMYPHARVRQLHCR